MSEKISTIISEELTKVEGNLIEMPLLQPKQIWEQSGRWEKRGEEMFTLMDRKESEYCLAPTHEEGESAVVEDVCVCESLSRWNSFERMGLCWNGECVHFDCD